MAAIHKLRPDATTDMPRALERLKLRGRQNSQRAAASRAQLGDPVARLSTLLDPMPLDPDRWQEIIDEPYG